MSARSEPIASVTTLQTAGSTDTGLQRSDNQDAYGGWCDSDGRYLLVVADGLGGHRGGATASRLAIEAFEDVFGDAEGRDGESLLLDAFEAANTRIYEAACADRELSGMGTTGVALFVDLQAEKPSAWIAHVGDSRAYRLRKGAFERLTLDHTLRAQLRETRGMVTEELDDVPGADALMRALGPEPEVEVELHPISVEPGDRFLLCSDGLWGPVPDPDTADILARHSPDDAAQVLIAEANRRGGPDNVTLLILAIPQLELGETAGSVAQAPAGAPVLVAPTPARVGRAAPAAAIDGPARVESMQAQPIAGTRARLRWIVPAAGITAALIALWIVASLGDDSASESRTPALAESAVAARAPSPAVSALDAIREPGAGLAANPSSEPYADTPDVATGEVVLKAPAPIAQTRKMKREIEGAQRTFGAFSEALVDCDVAALASLSGPELRNELELRCRDLGGVVALDPERTSWRWLRPGVVRVDVSERSERGETPLRAVLESISQEKGTAAGSEPEWRVVSLEPRDRSASP